MYKTIVLEAGLLRTKWIWREGIDSTPRTMSVEAV